MDNSSSKNNQLSELEQKYIESLNLKEKQAYEIAKSHLGSSFSLIKSIGFIEWQKNNSK